ncbi:MAG: efflux RND transporter permease subunit [Leptospirales bacterium]|nr:efflux RND transporter permease subunit [Leptospirales bacterium]
MASLPEISIRRPVFAWILMLGLIFFGWVSFRQLGVSSMPDVDFPVVNVQLSMTGASPEVMETNIVDLVEDSILSVEGVKTITSTSSYGSANITVELNLNRNVDAALQEVQTRVAQAQKLLPKAMDPAIITKFNPEDQPIMFIALSNDKENLRDTMVYVRDHLKTEFSVVPGVGQLVLGGWVDRNLRVWANRNKLAARELTVADIMTAIGREHLEQPAGLIENPVKQYNVRSLGEAPTSKAFGDLPILYRGGQPIFDTLIRIRDVARVEDGLDDRYRISRFNGRSAVGIGIIKQRGTNAIDVARAAKKRMAELEKTLPEGYHLGVAFDSTRFIEESIGELEFTLVLSAILTSLVCYFFLGSWSSTINVLLAIPTSIMGTMIVLNIFGFTLNTFTLLALSLAIGIVVDDAIMVLENIVRHREMGEGMVEAARKGATEITFAAIATTLSICAIFLPVVFMSGIIGKFFFQFGVTITAAVLLSLLEALTLTPMRASQFLQVGHTNRLTSRVDEWFKSLGEKYRRLLRWCLDHRWTVLLISTLLFALSFGFLIPIKKEFVPAQDQSIFLLRVQTPVGSSIQYTDSFSKRCEDFLKSRPEVARYFVAVGGFQGGQTNLVNLFVTMHEMKDRPVDPQKKKKLSQQEFAGVVREALSRDFPQLRVSVQDLSMRGFSSSRGYPVEITVKGSDWEKLTESSRQIMEEMKKSGNFTDVDSNFLEGQEEAQIFPNRPRAAEFGVSVDTIGDVLGAMIGGVKAGQFTEGGHRYDIRVRMEEVDRQKVTDIRNLYVRNNRGELVSLADVTYTEVRPSLQSITRLNRQRAVTIFANPAPKVGQTDAIAQAIQIAKSILPKEYTAEATGSAQTTAESFGSLGMVLAMGIIVAYMILGSQFNSFLHPVTVLMALPFSFSGAVLALFVFGQSLNIYSFIALLLLMGLVKKNSIMLVDFTNRMRVDGLPVKEALLAACPVRLRPILMTSIATIAAAIPPALSIGPGGATMIPMAIAVIGGTIVSTLLTLVVIPCVYSLFQRFERLKPESMGH